MVSDKEHDAALAFDIWCQKKIDQGIDNTIDFSLDDDIEYHTLLHNYEIHTDIDHREIVYRIGHIILLMQEKIFRDHCLWF